MHEWCMLSAAVLSVFHVVCRESGKRFDHRLRGRYASKGLLGMDSSTTSLQIYRETTSLD